jgi:heme exporter protein C
MVWAYFTWGDWWSADPKQNTSAIALLLYFAYFVLRGSFNEDQQKARISAVYNLFAFAALIPLLYILPRMTDSLHPGNGGNPGFGKYDLDNTMRLVFYPAVIGWTLLGVWMANLQVRIRQNTEVHD